MLPPQLLAFDADDTLWTNQPYYDDVEARFLSILGPYADRPRINTRLYDVQRQNMQLFGYGAKSFMLSMIETAIELTRGEVRGHEIQRLIDLGKRLLDYPIEPLPGVAETLQELKKRGHPLMVLTKGDLFDQESKLARSGLGDFFDHVEIVSEKNEATYQRLLARYALPPAAFTMIGNSLKSDILPVARLGARAIYVPYHVTWAFEEVPAEQLVGVEFHTARTMGEVLAYLS